MAAGRVTGGPRPAGAFARRGPAVFWGARGAAGYDRSTVTASSPWPLLAAVAVGFLAAVFVLRALRRARARGRLRRGKRAERLAERLLRRHGFVVLEREVEGRVELFVDGCPATFRVRADALVARGSEVYVAEFKAGEVAGRLSHRATRRQLVEYMVAFDVDHVLLVDVARRSIREVALARPPQWTRAPLFEP